MRVMVLLALTVCAWGQPAPVFQARDVRPQWAAEQHPLLPGMGVWIFGEHLGRPCGVENMMDPRTYKTELCGVRVLFGGIEAKLLYTSFTQINLIAPEHPWENELVNVQVVRDGAASAAVPVRFGADRPVISLAEPAFTGMPVWVRVELPWRRGMLRYPHWTEPWDLGPGGVEVRFEGMDLPKLAALPYTPRVSLGMMVGLPHEPRQELLGRTPLHLLYALDRPGTYDVRFTSVVGGWKPQASEWTPIEVRASTLAQRQAWWSKLVAAPPRDPVEILADFLPSVLAVRDEAALRIVAQYLDSPDQVLQQYARYALNYFDVALRKRVVPGREPLRGGVGSRLQQVCVLARIEAEAFHLAGQVGAEGFGGGLHPRGYDGLDADSVLSFTLGERLGGAAQLRFGGLSHGARGLRQHLIQEILGGVVPVHPFHDTGL